MATGTAIEITKAETDEKYTVFTKAEKWCIVAMVAYAAWFSTLTSFIYYPAIDQLSQTFSVSVDKINLTITSYLAVATVAPTLVGDTADVLGRRPVYVVALSLYLGANVAIVLADSYSALLGIRVLQALAISGMLFGLKHHFITDIFQARSRLPTVLLLMLRHLPRGVLSSAPYRSRESDTTMVC